MGLKLILLVIVIAAAVAYFWPCLTGDLKVPVLKEDGYWGRTTIDGKIPPDDKTIRPFTVEYKEADVKDLKERLLRTRLAEPLETVQFQYGFNTVYLQQVIDYWRTKYDWRKQVAELNKFSHFTTQIEGIVVHFLHVKPKVTGKIRVLPLLLIHGWPGSVVEFYKMIPLLTTPKEGKDYVFEVICPSIPGYGFSEDPHKPGFNIGDAARVFTKLMDRLNHEKFYVQGGDWGSAIGTLISSVYPERVSGVYLNITPFFGKQSLLGKFKYAISFIYPSIFLEPKDQSKLFPFFDKVKFIMREIGYLYIQATKPDTVGVALSDSPAGLAAYILEKFSTWTDRANVDLTDGGLTKKFTLDELLTNVMVYWVTNSITPSVRFYKENFQDMSLRNAPVSVPSGFAVFPNELIASPKIFIQHQFKNIVQYNDMPRGGHFAAMEEPQLLAEELWKFAETVQKIPKTKK